MTWILLAVKNLRKHKYSKLKLTLKAGISGAQDITSESLI
jgi:hypothetical protein